MKSKNKLCPVTQWNFGVIWIAVLASMSVCIPEDEKPYLPITSTPMVVFTPTQTLTAPTAYPALSTQEQMLSPTMDPDHWTFYPQAAHLTRGQVNMIKQAPDGAMWFMAGVGLTRFRDNVWTSYPIDELFGLSERTRFAFTPDGDLWIGSEKGVFRFDGDTWTQYTIVDGLVSNDVTALDASSDGIVWIAHPAGISMYDGECWMPYPSFIPRTDVIVHQIVAADDGIVWFGLSNGEVFRFDGEHWTSKTVGISVSKMALSPDGSLWVVAVKENRGVWDVELVHIIGDLVVHYAHPLLSWAPITELAISDDMSVWITELSKFGVVKFAGERWMTLYGDEMGDKYTEQYLDFNGAFSICEDRAGALWIGTVSGVYRYMP